MPKKRVQGTGSIFKRGRIYWIAYDGPLGSFNESSYSTTVEEARIALESKINALRTRVPTAENVTISQLVDLVFHDYAVNDKRSYDLTKARWQKHMAPVFGDMAAHRLISDNLQQYVASRLSEGAAKATINREMALLRRAFNLGAQTTPPKVMRVPHFPMMRENNVRLGFLANQQYDKLAAACAKRGLWLRTMFELACQFGWRSGEIKDLRVRQVDTLAKTVRLDPGTTKNGDGREAYMPRTLASLMQQCVIGKQPEDFVFTRPCGKEILDFRGTWEQACAEAGCPDLLFHDLRRTAVRNMIAAGIPEVVAMKISGHRTRTIFDRYHIVAPSDLRAAAEKMEPKRADDANSSTGSARPESFKSAGIA